MSAQIPTAFSPAYLADVIYSGFLEEVSEETGAGIFLLYQRDWEGCARDFRLVRASSFAALKARGCCPATTFYRRLRLCYPGQLSAAERLFRTRIEDLDDSPNMILWHSLAQLGAMARRAD
jgi:hypothetical protein